VIRGGLAAPDAHDEEEAIFGDQDPTPAERREQSRGLRQFLLNGQAQWRLDGGVSPPEHPRDPAMGRVLRIVEKALRRRPTSIMNRWEDARDSLGTFWHLDDFAGLPTGLHTLVAECRLLELEQIEQVRATGWHVGKSINEQGCKELGVPDDLIDEWTNGVWFDVDPDVPHYSKGPYSNIYQDLATLEMACREFNKLLRWLIPVLKIPWIESRTTVVSKDAPLEPGGRKHRTCVDLTDSGLNRAVKLLYMSMTKLMDILEHMGPGSYMAKQDLKDMFYSWAVHPHLWTFLGVRHPVTGQSFVFPVLPMGFKLSPPIACKNTEWLAALIQAEMRARWAGAPSIRPALEAVPRSARPTSGVEPASHVYVDDYMGSAAGSGWIEELVDVGALIFRLVGVIEKVAKREGPSQVLCLLGFLFDSLRHQLKIPAAKAEEICFLLDRILERVDRRQSVAYQELSSMIGKLVWASPAVILGKAYIRHMRKPLLAVQDLLPRRRDRDRFCLPLWHFDAAVAELRWHREALREGGGSTTCHVGPFGTYEFWRWYGAWGDRVPADVVQWATDASKWGGGFQFGLDYRVRRWTREEARMHINVLEGLMVLQVIQEMGESCRGRRCIGWCDNTTAVQAINTGRSRSNLLMQIVRRIHLACIRYDIQLWMVHIPGLHNITADQLSRGVLAARVSNWSLVPRSMARWRDKAGGFDIDAFDSPSGATAQAPKFRSAISPLTHTDFRDQKVWAFPPSELVTSFLAEAPSWHAAAVTALVPTVAVPSSGWRVWHTYPAGARLFQRPVGAHTVQCKGSGLSWSVISLMV